MQSLDMDLSRALDDIAEIHRQMAKTEVYRGYRSAPFAASAVLGAVAASLQPAGLGRDPVGFVTYWTAIAVCAGFIGASEIVYNYVVHDDTARRRQTRRVVGQFLPSFVGGGAITAGVVHAEPGLIPMLPGIWALCFGIGAFASRLYLPRATGWVALYYYAAGLALMWTAHEGAPLSAWSVGGTFAAGQLLASAVLWWNLERE
jgi:hypothetical protein